MATTSEATAILADAYDAGPENFIATIEQFAEVPSRQDRREIRAACFLAGAIRHARNSDPERATRSLDRAYRTLGAAAPEEGGWAFYHGRHPIQIAAAALKAAQQ